MTGVNFFKLKKAADLPPFFCGTGCNGGVTETSVTMAAKSHLRNLRPLIIGLCTNDGLSANLSNIGIMLAKKSVYFVPFYQDDADNKPNSLVCDMSLVYKTYESALEKKQLQPVIYD